MHLYQRHFSLAERITASSSFSDQPMPAMGESKELKNLLRFEREVRSSKLETPIKFQTAYWEDLARVLLWHRYRKEGRDGFEIETGLSNTSLRLLLEHLNNRT